MANPLNTILGWFQTGDFPNEKQFAESGISFYHKGENIPIDNIENPNMGLQDNTLDVGELPTNTTISPASNYLIFWDGNDFAASSVYYDGAKYGIDTTTPSEMLHLNNGRLRTKAMVFDENTETLPHQITYNNERFYGTDLTGTARTFMFKDFADYKSLWEGFTNAQKINLQLDFNYLETTVWYNGTAMTNEKVDDNIFIKKGGKYFQKTIPKDILLKIGTISELRQTNAYYEGQEIVLLGYYESGDKTPVIYKFSVQNFTSAVDDGGLTIKTDRGVWIAAESITKKWLDVEHFGIFPSKTNSSDIIFASAQVKKMAELGLKMKFNKGDYYLNNIEFTTNIGYVYIKGECERKVNYPGASRILTQGNNFMLFNFTQNAGVFLFNIILQSVGATGSCFEKIQSSGDSDFSILGKTFSIRLFEKGFYTPSFGTGIDIQDFIFENNKYGLYCGKATNIARIVKGNFFANQYGLKVGGYNAIVEQVQVSVRYPFLPAGEKCIGISTDYATIRDVYNEEYGGTSGLSPDTHILIQHKLTYIPNSNEGFLRLERIGFPNNDLITHLDIDHTANIIGVNKISIIADAEREIPRVIKTGPTVKFVQGIQVNGNNITRASASGLLTTQFYNYVEAKIIAPFTEGYTAYTDSDINSSQINIATTNIDGYEYMFGTDTTGSAVNAKLFDQTRKAIRPNAGLPFLIEFDFTLMVSSEMTVCLVLNNSAKTERLGIFKSVQIGSTGNYLVKIKGSTIETKGSSAPYTVSLGFDSAFTVPNTTDLSNMKGYYHVRSFPLNYYSARNNRNGLV
ncbi:hypothetical protein ASG22_16090 [Chryseobacterium sp. Leaf405]|uniref:hypothetical protein n=1 Tax=Chryseobacterium sp. Leaf405 TaxID=1736367 RepID=UPI0006F44D94|nr:hypothetical protein [Chryseobacterium sp. Leaf405]KQT20938.1 hypothetical protein ASG22_16090 [Chryseobacterium sp. Leaf405]